MNLPINRSVQDETLLMHTFLPKEKLLYTGTMADLFPELLESHRHVYDRNTFWALSDPSTMGVNMMARCIGCGETIHRNLTPKDLYLER